MKKFFIFLILLEMLSKTYAQKADGLSGIGASAGITGAILSVDEAIQYYKEQLKFNATEYMLANHPETPNFELKLLNFEKFTDLSDVATVVFSIRVFDPRTDKTVEKQILLMFTSYGWANKNGIDITKIKFELLNKKSWDSLFFNYVSLAAPIKIDDQEHMPTYKMVINETDKKSPIAFNLFTRSYSYAGSFADYLATGKFSKISDALISNNGFALEYVSKDLTTGQYKIDLLFPFLTFNKDQYICKDFSNEFKIIYNDLGMSLYVKSINRLVAIPKSTLNTIQKFVNYEIESK